MSVTVSQILATTRAIVIDQLEDGVDPTFTDNEIIEAANVAKDDFFGIRPEAFSKTAIATESPSDLADRQSLSLNGTTVVTFDNITTSIGAALSDGSIAFDFKASVAGTLFYSGDGADDFMMIEVTAAGVDLTISDVAGAKLLTINVLGSFLDSQWRHVEASFIAGTTTVVVDYDNEETDTDYDGDFIPDTTDAYFGADSAGAADLTGSVDNLVIKDSLGVDKADFGFDDGTGLTVTDSVAGEDGSVVNPIWVAGDTLVMATWAHRLYYFGVASFLLAQRGKDSYYRKAAETTRRLYLGG